MNKLVTAGTILFCIALLWVGSEVFIPLTLAFVLAMLLSWPVQRLEKWRVPRVIAVTTVVLAAFVVLLGIGWLIYAQLASMATPKNIATFKAEIISKTTATRNYFRGGQGGTLQEVVSAAKEVKEAVSTPQAAPTTQSQTQPTTKTADEIEPDSDLALTPINPILETAETAVDQTRAALGQPPVVEPSKPLGGEENPLFAFALPPPETQLEAALGYLGMTLSPLGTAGIVIIFVFFILLEREDIRDRAIRLVSAGRYTLTTTAVDDGVTRIGKYLRAQVIVNGTYGLTITVGLLVIGLTVGGNVFPSFLVWGLMAAMLRFIPYIGPWISAVFPLTIALAAYPGFGVFAAVLGMIVVIELLSNNVMEPMLYGASTGLSTMAILVSAVFWTWLWGPIGLLLATPLTVVMMVLGRYVPGLEFLEVLLGDRPAMTPSERVYQRLLAGDEDEALSVMEEQAKENGMQRAFDEALLPALAMSERDAAQGLLNEERQDDVHNGTRRIIESLGVAQTAADAKAATTSDDAASKADRNDPDPILGPVAPVAEKPLVRVALLPAHDEADELAALMLARLLKDDGVEVLTFSHNALASEMVEQVKAYEPHAVLISATPPAAVSHVKYLLRRFDALPEEQLAIGVWSAQTDTPTLRTRLNLKKAAVSVTLKEALDAVGRLTEQARLAPAVEK